MDKNIVQELYEIARDAAEKGMRIDSKEQLETVAIIEIIGIAIRKEPQHCEKIIEAVKKFGTAQCPLIDYPKDCPIQGEICFGQEERDNSKKKKS